MEDVTASIPWVIRSSRIVIDRPHLRLRADTIELPGGEIVDDYYVRESRGFAVIFAMTADQRVVLVRQYKHGIGRTVLELPAGAIDPGEDAMRTAERELLEETGFACPAGLRHVRTFTTDPTNANTRAHLYFGRDAMRVATQNLEITEQISVELAPIEAMRSLVHGGGIDVAIHVAAIYLVLDFPELLRLT